MLSRTKKEKLCRSEIHRSLLISNQEKSFWLKQISTLPEMSLERILEQFKLKNHQVDAFIKGALENDSDHQHLAEFKALIQKIKKNGFQLEEKYQGQDPESFLSDHLTNL